MRKGEEWGSQSEKGGKKEEEWGSQSEEGKNEGGVSQSEEGVVEGVGWGLRVQSGCHSIKEASLAPFHPLPPPPPPTFAA